MHMTRQEQGSTASMIITPCEQLSVAAPYWCETKLHTADACNALLQADAV